MFLSFSIVSLAFVGLVSGQCSNSVNYLSDKGEGFDAERSSCHQKLAFEFNRDNCPEGSEQVAPGKCRKFGQGINFQTCDLVSVGDICEAGGWAYQVESVRVKNGALVKTKDGVFRTSMKRESTVDVCVFGKINVDRLASSPKKLQFQAHGEIEGQNLLAQGIKLVGDVTGTGSELAFCKETGGELKANVCSNAGSTCGSLDSSGVQNFCACTSLNVPAIPSLGLLDKLKVKVTLKMLHSPDEDDLNQCVRQFSIQKLFNEDKKQTLACINIPTFIPPK